MEPMLPGESASQYAIRMVTAELEAADREDDEIRDRLSRAGTSPSVTYALRLDPDELAALRRRADSLGMRPTVLARSLIRSGLQTSSDGPRGRAAAAVEQLDAALTELRAVLG